MKEYTYYATVLEKDDLYFINFLDIANKCSFVGCSTWCEKDQIEHMAKDLLITVLSALKDENEKFPKSSESLIEYITKSVAHIEKDLKSEEPIYDFNNISYMQVTVNENELTESIFI